MAGTLNFLFEPAMIAEPYSIVYDRSKAPILSVHILFFELAAAIAERFYKQSGYTLSKMWCVG